MTHTLTLTHTLTHTLTLTLTHTGTIINLRHPYNATSFLPANIGQRVQELQKQNQEVYGKAGFWEEFEVWFMGGASS